MVSYTWEKRTGSEIVELARAGKFVGGITVRTIKEGSGGDGIRDGKTQERRQLAWGDIVKTLTGIRIHTKTGQAVSADDSKLYVAYEVGITSGGSLTGTKR